MKIIIVGYGEMFQALVLGVLKTEHEIVGVYTQDNIKKSLISSKIANLFNPSSDFTFSRTHQLNSINAKSVNSQEFIEAVTNLKADIILVGSWSEKFSMQTINAPKKGCINVHPAMLPKYRGPNPYLQVILNNEEKTGVTYHLMDVNYDTGSILHQIEIPILPNDTGKSLKYRCCDYVRENVAGFLKEFPNYLKNQKSQNEKDATYQHQITLEESILDFTKETSEEIDRRIRALTPWLDCHIPYKNEFFTFSSYKIRHKSSKKAPATIVKLTNNSMYIVCKDGKVIEFSSLKIKRPFSRFITKYYFEKVIKINQLAL